MKSRHITIRQQPEPAPIVWVVDSEQWPRACLRAELIERGYDAYGFVRIGDALDALSNRTSPKPALLILESRDQPMASDVIRAVQELGVPTILLVGNTEPGELLAPQQKWDVVLRRPFSIGQIADVTQQIISKHDQV